VNLAAHTTQQSLMRRSWVVLGTKAEVWWWSMNNVPHGQVIWGQDRAGGIVPWLAAL